MVKAIKAMLIPNNVQKTKMFQYAGASRFAYNWALAREKENYEKGGKFISDAELRKEFTKLRHSDEYAWLLSISNNVTKQAIKDACTACSCCGNIKKDLKLSDRIYKCDCGNVIDRDFQASINLKAYGERVAS